MDAKLKPGTTVKILAVEKGGPILCGFRYGIILRSRTKKYSEEIDGYDVLVGSKIEWFSAKGLLFEDKDKEDNT